MSNIAKMLPFISNCDEPAKLRTIIKNARSRNETGVADAAFRRLISLVPSEKPGTLEHDFWQAFEFTLSEERGKTTRLSRTRQKVRRVGVIETLKDWALSDKDTDGFAMLLERGMPELTGEAVVLLHPERFTETVLASARSRLIAAGVDLSTLAFAAVPQAGGNDGA